MALILVSFFVIVFIFIFGLIEKLICNALPFLKTVKRILIFSILPLFFIISTRPVVINGVSLFDNFWKQPTAYSSGTFENAIGVIVITGLYIGAIVSIKLLLFPLAMFMDMQKATKPDKPQS
jgi:hypothetical protein